MKTANQTKDKIYSNKAVKKDPSATEESSNRMKNNGDIKQKTRPSQRNKHVGVEINTGETKHTSTRRVQKRAAALKRRPSFSLRKCTGRTRLSRTCLGSVKQSPRRRSYRRPSESTLRRDSVNKDVYDIDESAINMPRSRRSAREKKLSFMKPKYKMLSKKTPKRNQKDTNEMIFINSTRSSTLAARSSCDGGSCKRDSRYCDQQMSAMAKNNDINWFRRGSKRNNCGGGSKHNSFGGGSKHNWCRRVPVCTLMNEEFRCPVMKINTLVWKTDDARTRQVILDTVPIGNFSLSL